jgi:hypothetical protein
VKLTDKEIADAYAVAANQNLRPQDKVMVFAVSRAIEAALLAKIANRQDPLSDEWIAAFEKRGSDLDADNWTDNDMAQWVTLQFEAGHGIKAQP